MKKYETDGFRTLVDALPNIAVQGYNSKREVIYWNQASEKLYGYTEDEAIGQKLEDLIIPEIMKADVLKAISDWIEKGIAIESGELDLIDKEGNTVPVYSSHVLLDEDDNGPKMFCLDVDISQQRASENLVKLQKQKLEELNRNLADRIEKEVEKNITAEQEHRHTLENAQRISHLGSWELDLQTDTLHWSDEVYRIFGEIARSFDPTYENFLSFVYPDDRDMVNKAYLDSVREKKDYAIEHRILRKDGSIRYVNERCHHKYTENGDLIKSIGTVLDVTHTKHLEQENRKKDQMLFHQSKNAAMGEMISNIAHQWRQPLNIISLAVSNFELLYKTGNLTEEVMDRSISEINSKLHYLSETIDDFRQFFYPDKQKHTFTIKQTVNEALNIIGATFRTHQIAYTLQENNDITLYNYKNELEQVLINILNNAKDAIIETEQENGQITIEISGNETIGIITISDNGGGIPEDIADKIFEPYFTTKFEHQGTGLGLFMAKMIVEKSLGGSVNAENSEDGASFTIVIPNN